MKYRNMITYLKKYGNISFEDEPFNEVDSLILSQFGYLNLDLFINHPHDEVFLKDVINKDKYVERLMLKNRIIQ